MSSRKRARTRAVRAEMTATGENYSRAANRVGDLSQPEAEAAGGSGDGVAREHVRRVLHARRAETLALMERVEELEREGHRIIDLDQISEDGWAVHDWRTGGLLVEGGDGLEGYDAACERLDPQETWILYDNVYMEIPLHDVSTDGLPDSLARDLEDWVGTLGTPDEDIAAFVGWTAEQVRSHRG